MLENIPILKNYNVLSKLKKDLCDCSSVLELGCGEHSPLIRIGYGNKTTGVDIYDRYIKQHQANNDYKECFVGDVLKIGLKPKSFDAVVLLDILEHLTRTEVEARLLLSKAESAAIKKVIIITPNGYIANGESDTNLYQRHISAWYPEDFVSRGYYVRGVIGWKPLIGEGGEPKYKPRIVWQMINQLAMPVVHRIPDIAASFYAIKST